MSCKASEILALAKSWIGKNEKDGSHKSIIDIYNSQKPLPRGYKVKYTDSWCASFISALAIKCGATDIIPTECSCQKMIELFKKLGVWVENENRTPVVGDIVFYDWQDSGNGDNTGWSDHVGIVEKVSGKNITVIEGNLSDAVGRRVTTVNSRYIRGYATPKYLPEVASIEKEEKIVAVELLQLSKGSKGEQVKTLQRLLKSMGYSIGWRGVDGDFGKSTLSAVQKFQKASKLTVDGVVGANTWNALLK